MFYYFLGNTNDAYESDNTIQKERRKEKGKSIPKIIIDPNSNENEPEQEKKAFKKTKDKKKKKEKKGID